jgi:hypothetical protein
MKYVLLVSALYLSACGHRPETGSQISYQRIPEHIPGISCPASDGSHGPCPFGCTAEEIKAWKGWLISR